MTFEEKKPKKMRKQSLPEEKTEKDLCYYVNGRRQLLVLRIANIPNWYFERVVFPKERLLFAAPPTANLEIHQHNPNGTTLSDIIPCKNLLVDEVRHNDRATEFRRSLSWDRVGDRQTA